MEIKQVPLTEEMLSGRSTRGSKPHADTAVFAKAIREGTAVQITGAPTDTKELRRLYYKLAQQAYRMEHHFHWVKDLQTNTITIWATKREDSNDAQVHPILSRRRRPRPRVV